MTSIPAASSRTDNQPDTSSPLAGRAIVNVSTPGRRIRPLSFFAAAHGVASLASSVGLPSLSKRNKIRNPLPGTSTPSELSLGSPDSLRSVTTAETGEQVEIPSLSYGAPVTIKTLHIISPLVSKAQARHAQRVNDSMVYLDGPDIYACGECGTHLSAVDDIVSKSFHGRHGRAFLLEHCVNIDIGPAENRRLLTGLHSVCDIFCKRCETLVGWTYKRAYEPSQKYKEGKFIVEKIYLHQINDFHSSTRGTNSWNGRQTGWKRELACAPTSGASGCAAHPYRHGEVVYEY